MGLTALVGAIVDHRCTDPLKIPGRKYKKGKRVAKKWKHLYEDRTIQMPSVKVDPFTGNIIVHPVLAEITDRIFGGWANGHNKNSGEDSNV